MTWVSGSISILGLFWLSSGSIAYAGAMGTELAKPQDALYVGAFGGGGAIMANSLQQQGTAFFAESSGGALAVNARGESKSTSAWLVGGHVGYRWPARSLNLAHLNATLAPATELEGYYLGGVTIEGNDQNNDTTRLVEHNFHVTYPMKTSVFLVNGILNGTHTDLGNIHPYIGVGVGTAILSISGANSTQTAPLEPDINHYNSGSSDARIAFAAQPKVGASFRLSQQTSMFVEYRFLYLSATDYTFGSTVYPTHVVTSNWDVKIASQYYNMGTIGVQFDL